ncbi:hypothetical protein B0H66DRAFT_638966 [Apodospora peruviana]|uniref:Transcription factor Iwr1 domain-containing protein n=1 Tax=Apodospora peruviana TaxID=516989 RepID=A0AAE0ICC7_9PEZI|nr:hypothetical protein B0H66DRAFT_638966 [Apodospora peruviana]
MFPITSQPPQTIQVKRKRGSEDGPVDFLRIDRDKRLRGASGDSCWVYQLIKPEDNKPNNASRIFLPVIQATQEGDENRPLKAMRRKPAAKAAVGVTQDVSPPAATALDASANEKMRRFHLSLSNSTQQVRQKRGAPATFVERTPKKQKESNEPSTRSSKAAAEGSILSQPLTLRQLTPNVNGQESSQIKYKRPGARARTKVPMENNKPKLPPSLVNRRGVDIEQLARDMDAYTLSQINQNIAKIEEESSKVAARHSETRKTKYRPKIPPRYAERHPEEAAKAAAEREREKAAAEAAAEAEVRQAMAIDGAEDETIDGDYVTDDYLLVPASRLREPDIKPNQVGLLVFDKEPDMIEFFYGEEGDSEDEFPEDEENENAENYYGADYPDEDLDWDDEFDRNAYLYRNSNASDEEEFDLDSNADASTNADDDAINFVWDKPGDDDAMED